MMDIPPVFIQQSGNGRNRLTVAKNRITLKLREDVTEENETHLILFAQMIAQRTLNIYKRTMRGCFSRDLQSVEMMNTSRTKYCLYCFDELEIEGFSTDKVGSDVVKQQRAKRWGCSQAAGQSGWGRGWSGVYGQTGWGQDWDDFVD